MRSRPVLLLALVATLVVTMFAGVAVANDDGPSAARHHRHNHRWALVSGTVTAVDGANFTVTKRSGRTVAVATTAKTRFVETTPATVADVTPGSRIAVDDHKITILPAEWNRGKTVVSNDGATIVVQRKDGSTASIPVDAGTKVKRTVVTDLSAVGVGDRAVVAGKRDNAGSVVATWVALRPAKAAPAPAPAPAVEPAAAPAPEPEAKDDTKVLGATETRDDHDGDERGAVAGKVTSIAAPNFTVESFRGTKTVTTSGDTTFLRTVDATIGDASVGSVVSAFGRRGDDGVVHAAFIRIHTAKVENTRDGWCDEGIAALKGAVKANDGETLTVATAKGDVAVRASDLTKITMTKAATLADVTVGSKVLAVGTHTGDGTLAAKLVHVDAFSGRAAGGIRHHDGDRQWDGSGDGSRDGTRDGDRQWDGSRDGSRDGRYDGRRDGDGDGDRDWRG